MGGERRGVLERGGASWKEAGCPRVRQVVLERVRAYWREAGRPEGKVWQRESTQAAREQNGCAFASGPPPLSFSPQYGGGWVLAHIQD